VKGLNGAGRHSMSKPAPVFILCGGLGTRLRKIESRPKAIIPIAGLPFLTYSLRLLRRQGFRRFHLLVGVGAEAVVSTFTGSEFSYSREEEPLGTGGALGLARDLAARNNLILNGDSYAELLYSDLLSAHRARGREGTHGLTLFALPMDECADYGAVEVDPEGRVTAFREKGVRGFGLINAGVYAAGGGFFRDLPAGSYSLEKDVLPELAARGRLWARSGRFFFRDIGTPERLALAQKEFRWIRARFAEDVGDGRPATGGG